MNLPKYVSRETTAAGRVRYRFQRRGFLKVELAGEPGSPEFEAAYKAALSAPKPKSEARLPQYVSREERPSGERFRFRRRGFKVRLPGEPGSAEFTEAYESAMLVSGPNPEGAGTERTKPGTIAALVAAYLQSPAWKALGQTTREMRDSYVEGFREACGQCPIAEVTTRELENKLAGKTPAQQFNWKNVLSSMFRFGVKAGLCESNPVKGVEIAARKSKPHKRWEDEDIAAYRRGHPIGTKARLVFEILLNVGLRRSDAVRLGPAHIFPDHKRGKGAQRIKLKTQKKGVWIDSPVTPELAECIAKTNMVGLTTFIVGEHNGQPMKPSALGHMFRKWCDAVGLPELTAHGLRHAMGASLSEEGATPQQIQAVLGHKDIRMSIWYCQQAATSARADDAFALLKGRARS